MKSFEFPTDPRVTELPPLEINGVKIDLATDLTGLEVIEGLAACAAGNARGVTTFLYRTVPDEQWIEFQKQTRGARPIELIQIAREIADAYVAFPTSTEEDDSSTGASNTGSTSGPVSVAQE